MYVYFMRCRGYFKIGKANNPESRIRDLQCGNPYRLSLVGKVRCESEYDACQREKRAHLALAHYRKRGEWFQIGHMKFGEILNALAIQDMRDQKAEAACRELDRQWLAAIDE